MWLVGAFLNLGAMKAGYAWQKALAQMDESYGDPPRPIYRIRTWQTGAMIFLSGNILQFLSYAFAAQSLLLALASVQFATHLLFAWVVEGVSVPLRSTAGAAIVILSNILLVVFSSKSGELLTAGDLLRLYSAPGYVAYQVVAALLCTASCSVYGLMRLGQLHTLQQCQPVIAPVLLALGAAIPGTQTLVATKALSMMLVVSVGRQNQVTHWFFWVMAVTPLATASLWTAAMKHGLCHYPSIIMLPLLQMMYTAVGIMCGVLFFQEYRQMSTVAIVMYVVGLLGMFSGIGLSISPDALAAGMQEMKDQNAADMANTASSDSCDSCSSDEEHVTAPVRKVTLIPQRFAQTAAATARSTLHGAALTSIGMGEQHKLRCASIFVSPMALSAAGLGEDGARAAKAAQRRTTVYGQNTGRRSPALSLPAVREECASDDGLTPELRSPPQPGEGSVHEGENIESGRDRRGVSRIEAHPGLREHQARKSRLDVASSRSQTAGAGNLPVSQLDLLTKAAAQDKPNSIEASAGAFVDVAQLSTVQVVPAVARTGQASLSVSQVDVVSAAPTRSDQPSRPPTVAHDASSDQLRDTYSPAALEDADHATNVSTNYVFAAELPGGHGVEEQDSASLTSFSFDNPLAHEAWLHQVDPHAPDDWTMGRGRQLLRAGVEAVAPGMHGQRDRGQVSLSAGTPLAHQADSFPGVPSHPHISSTQYDAQLTHPADVGASFTTHQAMHSRRDFDLQNNRTGSAGMGFEKVRNAVEVVPVPSDSDCSYRQRQSLKYLCD